MWERGSVGEGENGSEGVWECGSAEAPHTPIPPYPRTPIPPNSHTPKLPHPHTPTLVIALLTILAVALRIIPWLAGYPLHRDEALYGFWARLIASGQDPLLLTAWVDKPPLVIYLLAAALKLFGVSELALRVPGMIADMLLIPAVYALARRVYGPQTATLAALLVAASPFAILFAPTAFTDPWLTLWLVVSVWAAVSGRPFWAGLTLGLAVASKQQGVLGVPLIIGLLLSGRQIANCKWQERRRLFAICHLLFAAILGFALILAPLTLWDSLRWHNRPSFWDRSFATYGGIALAPLAEWPQRAASWAEQLGYLWGAPLLSIIVLGLAGWGVERETQIANRKSQMPDAGVRRQAPFAALTAAFVLGYLALHFVFTFQAWDRYLLPLAPLVSVLAARGGVTIYKADTHAAHGATADEKLRSDDFSRPVRPTTKVVTTNRRSFRAAFALTLATLLGYASWLGAAARIPVGSDHGAYAGLTRVVAGVTGRPADAIVYHRSLGWYFDFYLFDAPQERRWFDTPARLVGAAALTAEAEPDREQWLAVAEWERDTIGEIETALAERGLKLAESERIFRPDGSRSFTLYRIIRPETPDGS